MLFSFSWASPLPATTSNWNHRDSTSSKSAVDVWRGPILLRGAAIARRESESPHCAAIIAFLAVRETSEQGSAVEKDVGDYDHPLQADELSFIHFIPSEHFGVVAEIAQEPTTLSRNINFAFSRTNYCWPSASSPTLLSAAKLFIFRTRSRSACSRWSN